MFGNGKKRRKRVAWESNNTMSYIYCTPKVIERLKNKKGIKAQEKDKSSVKKEEEKK